jgi:uncharacterized membrane protein (DUF485 family)
MDWYAPLALMPAIGLIIMSTSNFTVGLINEIERLEANEADRAQYMEIIQLKLVQLRRLSIAISLLYASVLLLLIASFSNYWAGTQTNRAVDALLILTVLTVATALAFLFIYSIKANQIRQMHLRL